MSWEIEYGGEKEVCWVKGGRNRNREIQEEMILMRQEKTGMMQKGRINVSEKNL